MKKRLPLSWHRRTVGNWHWSLLNDHILDPWFADYSLYEIDPVKKNPLRCVFKVRGTDGTEYYVKHDKPKGFFPCIKALCRSKSHAELKSCLQLQHAGIPCVEYVGYGRNGKESMLVTKALDAYISCQEYWYSVGAKDPEKARLFFLQLCNLIRLLLTQKVHHPDFHSANLMIHPESMDIVLIDLYGVGIGSGSDADTERLLQIFWDFSENLSEPQILDFIQDCTVDWPLEKCKQCWQKIYQKKLKHVEHEWPKRKRQILTGNSKFCRTQKDLSDTGSCVIIRNTPWYSPCERCLASLRAEAMPHEKAEEIWLESFRQQLEHRKIKNCPLAWRQNPDGTDHLLF